MQNINEYSLEDIGTGIYGPVSLSSKHYPFGKYENLLNDRFIPTSMYTWYKSTHEKSKRVANLARNPQILEIVKKFIGKDVILWGSHFIHQKPRGAHSWHADVEHMNWDGVTVWVGLKNLSPNSSLSIMSYSHEFNCSPPLYSDKIMQEELNRNILEAAKVLNSKCEIKTFNLKVGEFIVWSGKAWHTTRNESNQIRHSIILQYCRPNAHVRIPLTYEYPHTKWSTAIPPCLSIDGLNFNNKNLLIINEKTSFINEIIRIIFVIKGRLIELIKKYISI